jgi:DNA integrity scanning protein DisA with diadenylate cyclase activity
MRIAFHSEQLGIRGTEVALYDYALYFEEILKGKAFIISNANADLATLEKFQNRFDVFLYQNFLEVSEYLAENNISYKCN